MNLEEIYKRFLQCSAVCTDTRKIEQNCIFFALKGDNFNGNFFAEQAIEKGALYCIIDEIEFENDRCVLVDDVLATLQQLANFHRKKMPASIVALTGSNGKTTTKELINAVLSKKFNTIATIGNLNNHIGVPLTLLRINETTEIAIIEMGANHQKEIEFLCSIAAPDYGLITNFGKAHLEGFGGVEGVIKGKSELYDYLKKHQKTIFVNDNDALQVKKTSEYPNSYHFGLTTSKNASLELINSQPYVSFKYNDNSIQSRLTGHYNFNNIAVAIALGSYFKVNSHDIIAAVESYNPTNNRSQIMERGSNTIVMDAYNANPTSMLAALENFKQLEGSNKVLFLGDMFELGIAAEYEHQEIVNYLRKNNLGQVYLIGKNFFKTDTNSSKIKKLETFEDLKEGLQKNPILKSLMLIKGSRGMALERILELL